MMTSERFPVSVVRVSDIDADVARGLDLIGGLERFVRPGAQVLIKVNMFVAQRAESGKITHPAVVLALARMCHALGAHVTLVERLADYALIFEGLEEIRQVCTLSRIDDLPRRLRYLSGARSLTCQLPWINLVDACDVFINMPGLRTHALTKMSNGMKNLMGLLPENVTRLVHHHGLDGSICDLNAHRPSDLVVTEAIVSLEGNFPSEGSPVKTDVLTFADNVVAADLVAAKLVDQDPAELFYLQEAISRGMGPASLSDVTLLGDDLGEVAAGITLEPAPRDPEPLAGPFRLFIGDVCPSCRQALAGGLLAVSHKPELANLEGISIVAGHHAAQPDTGDDKVLVYGNCAYPWRHLGHYEPGCPPLAYQVAKGLEALRPKTIRPSICSIAWRDESLQHVMPIVADAGYDGIELWAPHVDRWLNEGNTLEELAHTLAENNLVVPMISGYYDFVANSESSLETARRIVGYCRELNVPLVRVFVGGGDSLLASIGTWRRVTEGLRAMCALAPDLGFALETHGGHLHATTDATLRLIRQVDAPNLCVNLDIYNLFAIGEDPQRSLQRLLPHVRICHLKNADASASRGEHVRGLAEGDMDYRPFLDALQAHNWGGFCSVEWFGPDPDRAAASELAFLRECLGTKEA